MGSYLFLVLAGFLLGPSHTLFVVAGQRLFPAKMAMISGVFLGFTFFSGAGGTWILGLFADRYGLDAVLGILPWVLLVAAALSLVGARRPAPKQLQAADLRPSDTADSRYSASMIASAISCVPTAVGSSRSAFRS